MMLTFGSINILVFKFDHSPDKNKPYILYFRNNYSFPKSWQMDRIKVLDKTFEIFITGERIEKRIAELSSQMEDDLKGEDIVFLAILNGSFMFAAELLKNFSLPCRLSFLKLFSYSGTESTGRVKELIGLNEDIRGKAVVVIEDIVDTGTTLCRIVCDLKKKSASSIKVVTLLLKPDAFEGDFSPDYTGFEIPNDFVVGYGLDYDGFGRNLDGIFRLVE